MLITDREEYDIIASLGGTCSAAWQLRHRGKRPYSLPLDWTLMLDDRPIRALPELIKTRFKNFSLPENMEEYEPPKNEYGEIRYHLTDKLTGYNFIHQYSVLPSNQKEFMKQRSVLMRRVDRFYKLMKSAKHALFVLNTEFPYDANLLFPVYEAMKDTFPDVEIEIAAMQFSADSNRTATLGGGKVKVDFIQRHFDIVYDNYFTAPEWRWMDRLRIAGLPLPTELRKKNLAVKFAYKIWRWLGKYLEHKCAGCASMKWRNFKKYKLR